jgi:hypothetical protein
MNILKQTKDARSVNVRRTRKDLFGTNAAEDRNLFLIHSDIFSFLVTQFACSLARFIF